ncbi:MAG TPA: hypothetical protein PLD95_03860 [bacterium]|nr:hypothetical protein [bacterium]
MFNFFKKNSLVIMLFIFIISVIIRIPNLNRPLSYHHEWLTAFSLRVVSIFYDNGAIKYNFNPIATYEGSANKNIDNTSVLFQLKDKFGNYYYNSYPPFSFILPYFLFKIFHIYPSILSIQIFNIILHFISAYFIFLIISLFTKNSTIKTKISAILGFIIYTFLPLNLWFHSNIYSAEILIQALYIIEIYLFFKIILSESVNKYYYFLLGIINFFAIYTEWLGLFLAATICLYLLLNIKKKKHSIVFFIIIITTVIPIILTIYQYSKISGLILLFTSYKYKFLLRSGFSDLSTVGTKMSEISAWIKLIFVYIFNFIPILLFMLPFSYVLLKIYKNKLWKKRFLFPIFIIITPIILHHIVFFNGTVAHDFFLLKDSIYLSIFGGLIVGYFLNNIKRGQQLFLITGIIFFIILSITIYYKFNNPYSSQYKNIGEDINRLSKNDEVLFIKRNDFNFDSVAKVVPQIIFYAKRNIAAWESNEASIELIKLNKASGGKIFFINCSDVNNGCYVSDIGIIN